MSPKRIAALREKLQARVTECEDCRHTRTEHGIDGDNCPSCIFAFKNNVGFDVCAEYRVDKLLVEALDALTAQAEAIEAVGIELGQLHGETAQDAAKKLKSYIERVEADHYRQAEAIAALTAERDRETGLRREAENHNAILRKALEAKPSLDEYEAVEAERDKALALLHETRGDLSTARARVAILEAESVGRLRVLEQMAEELRQEWIRAENTEAEVIALRASHNADQKHIEALFQQSEHRAGSIRELEAALATARARVEAIEAAELRAFLWLGHGHQLAALYGDDGEMQCHECRADYQRDPLERLLGLWKEHWTNRLTLGQALEALLNYDDPGDDANYCWWCGADINGLNHGDGVKRPHESTCIGERARAALTPAPAPEPTA